jgi:LytS/YehU family sensor histidine kinase
VKRTAVPTFSLQPLVENAIEHGISPRRDGGHVLISAQRQGGRLQLAVEDDGDGFEAHFEEGTGLGNLRERLSVMYRGAASLSIDRSVSGARVVMEVPLRTTMNHAAAYR